MDNLRSNLFARTLTTYVVCALVTVAAVLILPQTIHAQGVVTNQATSLTKDRAFQLWRDCFDGNDKLGKCEKRSNEGITTACTWDAVNLMGDKCTYTYPDNSRTVADPRDFGGTQYTNYDSSGKQVGISQEGGLTNVNSGTLSEGIPADNGSLCKNLITNPIPCIGNALTYMMSSIVGGLAWVILGIATVILWAVGGMFNWVVIKTVFEFGSTFGTSDGMLIAWGIMRDIGNIILLFSFIFMGLATILNTHALDEYSARKALPRLIIFAVLLNFSLFSAQIVIDVSNSFASVFTAQAGLKDCTGNDEIGKNECANNGIAGRVMQMAGLSSVWRTTSLSDFMKQPEKHAPVYIGLAIFVTITAVVLLAAAIMLVFRAVMLCLLMVLSPIGFAGMAIPPLQEFARRWWKQLLSNAFFAPVYLLLVLISLKIVDGLTGAANDQSFADALINGGMNAPQIFVIFAVVIAFMVAALTMARSMGAAGAEFATSKASAIVFGGVTRGTNLVTGGIGRGIRVGVQSLPGNKGAGWRRGVTAAIARPLETTNFDTRRIPGLQDALHHAVGSEGAHPAHHATLPDMEHQYHQVRDMIDAGTNRYNNEVSRRQLLSEHHSEGLSDDARRTLQQMSARELEALHGIKEGVDVFARNLTQGQFDSLMSSANVTDDQKRAIRAARETLYDATSVPDTRPGAAAGATITRAQRTINGMNAQQIGGLSGSTLRQPQVLAALLGRQIANLDPSNMDPATLAAIQARITAGRAAAPGTPERAQADEFDRLIGAAPGGVGLNPNAQRRWTGNI